MIQTLIKIGLSRKEAKVYLATLELAQDTVQNIAKKAEVNRPTTYVILRNLMRVGLASTFENNKKTFFVAEYPSKLKSLLQKERLAIDEKENELDKIIHQLHALNNIDGAKPKVRYFDGVEGLMALENYGRELFEKNRESYSITPIDILEKNFPEQRKDALKTRVSSRLKSKTIYTNIKELSQIKNVRELRKGIKIPRERFPINTVISIFPNLGIKLFYLNKSKPYGIMIESKELANDFKLYFDLAWEGAKLVNSEKTKGKK